VLGAGLLTALALAWSNEGFLTAARLIFLAHLPIMLVEGLITMFTVGFIARVRPEMLHISRAALQPDKA
jgi:cobalt/nickel transport system permease protein